MLCIALDGGYQLRNQVVALLELHVDVGKRVFAVVSQFHKVVVDADDAQYEDGYDDQNDNQCHTKYNLKVYYRVQRYGLSVKPTNNLGFI